MRLRKIQDGITINIVAGTSAILFSIDMEEKETKNLLGFYIRKEDLTDGGAYDVKSIKHFPDSEISPDGRYSTKEHPWQSFLWEDFFVSDGKQYKYIFTPVYGSPNELEYGKKISFKVKVPSRTDGEHEVYFNRGVAGSQAYASTFKNKRPDEMEPAEREKALTWLSKGLKEALIEFIGRAEDESWQLRGCFYEFVYPEVLDALKNASENGADVKIIYDSRHEASKNDTAIKAAKIPRKLVIRRASNPGYLQHNKYMVLSKDGVPIAVWFGSTNITEKAIFGHCNVGHIVTNTEVAKKYFAHWKGLKNDPDNATSRQNSIKIQGDITEVEEGMTVFFSPRPKKDILKLYAALIESSNQLVCGMFPFSFNKSIKSAISEETNNLKYIIINSKSKNTTLESNDVDNVIVYGGILDTPLYEWAKEVRSGNLFYSGIDFIHNKVIIIDPLTEHPIVITGSANFSDPSIAYNDENTIVIKGNRHLADLYFTEFSRIFNHYSVRQDIKKLVAVNTQTGYNPSHLRLKPKDWVTSFFKTNALKCKRRMMFSQMEVDQNI